MAATASLVKSVVQEIAGPGGVSGVGWGWGTPTTIGLLNEMDLLSNHLLNISVYTHRSALPQPWPKKLLSAMGSSSYRDS